MKTLKINELVEESLKIEDNGGQKMVDGIIHLDIEGELWSAHSVAVSYRDLLFFCDKGVANMLVDSYGDKHCVTLHDWERDEEN